MEFLYMIKLLVILLLVLSILIVIYKFIKMILIDFIKLIKIFFIKKKAEKYFYDNINNIEFKDVKHFFDDSASNQKSDD